MARTQITTNSLKDSSVTPEKLVSPFTFNDLTVRSLSAFSLSTSNIYADNLGSSSSKNYTQSDTPPLNPQTGDVWLKTDTLQKYDYYDGFWVETAGAAVTHDSVQTALSSGDYVFGGAVSIPNQTLAGGSSVVNMSLGDVRYGETKFSNISADSVLVSNTTTYQDAGPSISLTSGIWLITSVMPCSANSATAGARGIIALSPSCRCSGLWTFGDGSAASIPRTGNVLYGSGLMSAIGGNTSGVILSEFSTSSVIVYITSNTTLKQQFSQGAATPNTSTLALAGSFITARRLS